MSLNATGGTYADWISTFPGLRTADQATTADPDGDGRDNATEFAAGTNPLIRDLADGSPIAATEWHVAPAGNDTNAGTQAAPFQTIARALQSALPGDHIELHAGTYRETVNPPRNGTALAPITIESYHGENAVISTADIVPGPWTLTSNSIYTATAPGQLPTSFWQVPGTTVNGTGLTEHSGRLQATVVNEGAFATASLRTSAAGSAWNFFASPITWKVRGLGITSTGSTPLPLANATAYFSICTGANNGYSSEDAINIAYRGNGNLSLSFKKDIANSWGTTAKSLTDTTITGYDLTLGPETAGSVAYTFTIKRSAGADVVYTGTWAMSQADWSDGGTGATSYLSIFVQESVTANDLTQQFRLATDSYEIWKGSEAILLDAFDDGDLSTVNYYPAGKNTTFTSGYDQIFVDGEMQNEARFPNKTSTDPLDAEGATLTMNNTYAFTSSSFNGKTNNFWAGARFLGRVGQGWAWQVSTVASSSGSTVQLDSTQASTWWWPNYDNKTSDTGTGYLFGTLNLLDADREWYLQRNVATADTLFLRIAGGTDPTTHLVERKVRNWCLYLESIDYLTLRGLQLRGGAARLNGSGLTLENCDVRYLSHYLTFANGGLSDGGRAPGGGIVVTGSRNTIKGCTIYDTAGSGILASGYGHTITRNHIYNTDYSGSYAAGLVLNGSDHIATFNTIHDSGRDILRPTGAGLLVAYNDLSRAGRMAFDLGMTYAFGTDGLNTNGVRSRISYNWVHEPGSTAGQLCQGIYLDNYLHNFQVDHNVIWGFTSNSYGIQLNAPMFGNLIYHNTQIGCRPYNYGTWTPYPDSIPGADIALWTSANHGMNYIAQNNLFIAAATDPNTILENVAQLDFRPKAGSVAVDPATTTGSVDWNTSNGVTGVPVSFKLSMAHKNQLFTYHEVNGQGVTLPGINNGFIGATPDSGAYERGGAVWKPGTNGWSVQTPRVQSSTSTGLGTTRATAQATLISSGLSTTTVRLYWGTSDGGTNAASWANVVDLGTKTTGASIAYELLNLTRGTQYYYRFYVVNADGEHWSDAQSFLTIAALIWDAGGVADTSISLPANWSDDIQPDLAAGLEYATFGTGGSTATLDANAAFAGLNFNRNANFTLTGAAQLSLGSGGITATLPNTTARTYTINTTGLTLTADQTWAITNNTGTATLSVTSAIADGANSFSLTKTGSGTLNLSGDNSFDGDLSILTGLVNISHNHALGSTAGRTLIATTGTTSTGGQLRLSGGITSADPITITGTTEAGSFARAIANNSETNTLTGDITLDSPSAIRLGTDGGTLHLAGHILRSENYAATFQLYAFTGSTLTVENSINNHGGQLQVTGGGTVILNANSNQIGSTVIFFSGTIGTILRLGTNDALNPLATLTLGSTSASVNSDVGTFDLAGHDQTVNGLIGSVSTGASPAPPVRRLITNSVPATLSTLTVGSANATSTFDGVIADGPGIIALTKTGTGTLTLAAASSYSGATTVNQGTLSLTALSLADTAPVNLSNNGVLNLNFTGTDTIGALYFDGVRQRGGTWGAIGSGAARTTSRLTGTGLLQVPPGPYDAWIATFSTLSDSARDLTADPDGDGRTNLQEYIAGTDPNTPDEPPRLGVARSSEGILVKFNAKSVNGPGYPGLTRWFDLLCTTNLTAGPWWGVLGWTNIPGADQDIILTNASGTDTSYYRLQIRLHDSE